MNIIEDISRDGKHRWFVTFGNKAPWQTRLAIRIPLRLARLFMRPPANS